MSRRPIGYAWGSLLVWLALATSVIGESARPTVPLAPDQMRRVPAGDASNWPVGDWRPAPRVWLDDYLQAASLPPAARWEPEHHLWSARYEGRFESGELRGECDFSLRGDDPSSRPIMLSPLSLRWHDVTWGDEPAVYGTRLDGKTILLPDAGHSTGRAQWQLAGQQVFDRWEFSVQIPAAGMTEWTLDLPRELTLQSSAGVVEGPSPAAADEYRRWSLHVGRRVAFKLTCLPVASPEATVKPLLRESHVATLQGEGADIISDYELAASEPPGQLWLEIPPQLRVLSVTGGAETQLAFQVRTEGATRRLNVDWPTAPREPRLRVRSFGVVDWSAADPASLPLPRLLREQPVERQLAVHVRPPLQLQTCDHAGYRLTDRRLDAESTETWSFQALSRDADLKLQLSAPAPALTAQAATLADYRREVAQIRSLLRVTGGGGPTFAVTLECPADWDVTGVSTAAGSSVAVTGFHVTSGPTAQWRALSIDLAEPLKSGETFDCRINAVAVVRPLGTAFPLPGLRLAGGGAEGVIALMAPASAELVGDLPPLAASPDQRLLQQLTTLSADQDWSTAIFFDQSAVSRQAGPPKVSFELVTATRDPIGTAETLPATVAPARLDEQEPLFSGLRLTTQLASQGAATHRHTATYLLERPGTALVKFRLGSACTHIQLEVDGVSTRIVADQDGAWRTLQSVPIRRQVLVHYQSPATNNRFLQHESVPLPEWTADVPLTWRLIPAPTRACTAVNVPFSHVTEHEHLPWTARCFGPLARRLTPSPEVDGGQSEDKAAEADEAHGIVTFAPTHSRRGITELQAAAAPAELVLTTWNPQLAEQAAWALLMSTMTLGVLLRRMRWNWWRRLAPVVLLALVGATFLAPDSCARLSGGCLIGFLLALVLPRRLVLPRIVERRGSSSPAPPSGSAIRPATAAARTIAFVCGLLLGRPSASQPPAATGPSAPAVMSPAATSIEVLLPEQDGEASATIYVSPRVWSALEVFQTSRDLPSPWVLRDASYDITIDDQSDEAEVVARYEVLVRDSTQRQPLRLALDRVTFQSADAITVDGAPVTIIPASQGEAIIVLVEPAAQSGEDAAGWTRHRVEVRCQTSVQQDDHRRRLSFDIPVAASTVVRWSGSESSLASLTMPGMPARSMDRQATEFGIGGRSRIEAEWSGVDMSVAADAPAAENAIAVTHLEAGPLRRLGTSLIELPLPSGSGQQAWTIPLQPGVVVRRLRCGPELSYRLRNDRHGTTLDLLALSPVTEPPVITLESIIPTSDSLSMTGGTPLSGVLRTSDVRPEWISVRPQPGLTAAVLLSGVPARAAMLPADVALRFGTRLDNFGADFHRVRGEESWLVKVAPQPTQRRATADTRLRMDRNQVQWSCQIMLDVTGAATPLHRLRLSPAVQVDRVTAVQDGVDRLARFIRDQDRLDLILSRAYAGAIEIRVEGHLLVSDESPQPIPECDVVDGTYQSTISEITNAARWTAEVVRAQAGPTRLAANGDSLVYTDADTDPPISFRLISGPEAIAAEQVVQILRDGDGGWQQRINLELRPQGVTLGSVALRLPPSWGGEARLTPTADITSDETDAQGWRLIRLHPSRLRSGGYRVQLQSPLAVAGAEAIWQYAPLNLSSAQLRRSRVAMPTDFPFRPTSATSAARPAESPAGNRIRPFERGLLVDVASDADVWSFKADRKDAPVLSVPLMESVVWVDPSAGLRGATWLTVVAQPASELNLRTPPNVEVRRVSHAALPVEFERQPGRVTLRLPGSLSESPVVIDWSLPAEHWSGDVVPLLSAEGWSPGERLFTLVPTDAAAWRMPRVTPALEIACRRMSALVIAAELQSTQTFTLDSPLLAAIRQLDGRLERGLQAAGVSPELRQECAAVKTRWQRVHQLIAVETDPPGDEPARPAVTDVDAWLQPHLRDAIEASVIVPDQSELRLARRTPLWRGYLAAAVLVLAAAVIIWLQKWPWMENSADWFASRPDLVCLLLGGFWVWLLQPRLLGVLLIAVGLLLWSRRRPRTTPPTDTALVGPAA